LSQITYQATSGDPDGRLQLVGPSSAHQIAANANVGPTVIIHRVTRCGQAPV